MKTLSSKQEDLNTLSDTVRVKTRGKTRGRPSNQEKILGDILSYFYSKNKKIINEGVKDMLIYGNSIILLDKLKPESEK